MLMNFIVLKRNKNVQHGLLSMNIIVLMSVWHKRQQ